MPAPIVLDRSVSPGGQDRIRRRPMAPVRAGAIDLAPALRPVDALRLIGLDCLAHLQQNHAGALGSEDPEYIHQMRVALRRLRAALRLFRPALPERFAADLLPPLRRLAQTLGRARDLDVLMRDILAPVLAERPDDAPLRVLAEVIGQGLQQARSEARRALRRPGYGRLLRQVGARLREPGPGPAKADAVRLRRFARRRLRKLQCRVLALAAGARQDDPLSLHRLRIGIKRLRYGLEFFASLLPRRRVEKQLRLLVGLQDALGRLNDLANAGAPLLACAGRDARLGAAVGRVAAWHGRRHADLLAAIRPALKKLARQRLPR